MAPADPARAEQTAPVGFMFSSLRIRNYRLFATGQIFSNTGTWMQRVAQDWLVLSITGSATAVALTIALQFLPTPLLGLHSGVLADRYRKRTIMYYTQSAMGLTSLVLAGLTFSHQVAAWHIYVLAFALGVASTVDTPARQAFAAELVSPEHLRNAVSLNAASFSAARIVGPAVAAVLITAVGSGWAFLINGLSFYVVVTSLARMRADQLHPAEAPPLGDVRLAEGLRYVRRHGELLWPIVLVGFLGSFGFAFPIWLVAFADEVFDQGPGGYGLLNVLIAAGSLLGALLAARSQQPRLALLVSVGAAYGALVTVAAWMPSFWLLAATMVPIGVLTQVFNTTANSHLQLTAAPALRGRVMSLYVIVFVGGYPVGGPVIGWVTDVCGPRIGMMSSGAVVLAAVAGVAVALNRTTPQWSGRGTATGTAEPDRLVRD